MEKIGRGGWPLQRPDFVEEKGQGGGWGKGETAAGARGGRRLLKPSRSEASEAEIRMEKEFVEKENMHEDYFIGWSSWRRWLINSRGRRRWHSFST